MNTNEICKSPSASGGELIRYLKLEARRVLSQDIYGKIIPRPQNLILSVMLERNSSYPRCRILDKTRDVWPSEPVPVYSRRSTTRCI